MLVHSSILSFSDIIRNKSNQLVKLSEKSQKKPPKNNHMDFCVRESPAAQYTGIIKLLASVKLYTCNIQNGTLLSTFHGIAQNVCYGARRSLASYTQYRIDKRNSHMFSIMRDIFHRKTSKQEQSEGKVEREWLNLFRMAKWHVRAQIN